MRKHLLVFMFLMCGIGLSYAGGVTDNNNGNEGYLFVSTGENNGNNSVGHWTDPSFLKGDKGNDGLNGSNGTDGRDGINGSDGVNGSNGIDGYTPIKDIDYTDGKDGTNGVDGKDGTNGLDGKNGKRGKKGDTGSQGIAGSNGVDGATGEKGDKGDTGLKGNQGDIGVTGANGKDYDPSVLNEQNNKIKDLDRTQEIIGAEVRVYDGKKWTVTTFIDYSSTRNSVDRAGIRFTFKAGTSYEERRINELEAKLNQAIGTNQGKEVDTGTFYTDGTVVGYHQKF